MELDKEKNKAKRIMIVEDDEAMRMLLMRALENEGYEPWSWYSGDECTMDIERFNPDLIIMDIGLPGRDGIEVYETIEPNIHSPVIFISGRKDPFTMRRLSKKATVSFVAKEEGIDSLLKVVKQTIAA